MYKNFKIREGSVKQVAGKKMRVQGGYFPPLKIVEIYSASKNFKSPKSVN